MAQIIQIRASIRALEVRATNLGVEIDRYKGRENHRL